MAQGKRSQFIVHAAAGFAACGFATLVGTAADAALLIRNTPTENVTCSGGVCVATGHRAVLNVSQLTTMLGSGSVKVESGPKALDIEVRTALSWTTANRLTLDSERSITFDRPVTVTGPGGVTLTTNHGGSGGELLFTRPGRVRFWDLSSSLIVSGKSYVLVHDIATLAADIATNPSGNYALADNYDANVDGAYAAAPISTTFGGAFEGLGNTVSRLKIDNTSNTGNIGFFAETAPGSLVEDLRLLHVRVHVHGATGSQTFANVGGLVGLSGGTVRNVMVIGAVTGGSGYTNNGAGFYDIVGGIAGISRRNIDNAGVDGPVSSGANSIIGGLVGKVSSGAISGSSATGNVAPVGGQADVTAGGLVGAFFGKGSIIHSYATGNVTGDSDAVGGLVGEFYGATISDSHATGSVTNADGGGGLVGLNFTGTVDNCYATGSVIMTNSGAAVGGLVGVNGGTVENSFASGSVSAEDYSYDGGLVGANEAFDGSPGLIVNSYATGSVTSGIGSGSKQGAGGLVGFNANGMIQASYSTGAATASSGAYAGGLVAYDESAAGNLSNNYWDTSTSGISNPGQGAGNVDNDPGITGETTQQLRSGLPSGFALGVWAESPNINNGLPYLIANPPPQ